MEVVIKGKTVPVTTHKLYSEPSELGGLAAVSDYALFRKYVEECDSQGPVPRAIVVRGIERIAHRVVGVALDVQLTDASSGCAATQSLVLRDADVGAAVLLPVVRTEDGTPYGLFLVRHSIALGMRPCVEAFRGSVRDGALRVAHEALLTDLGADLSQTAEVAGGRRYTVDGEGAAPRAVLSIDVALPGPQVQSLAAATLPPVGVASVVAVPLDAVPARAEDTAALLAAALWTVEAAA